MPTKSRSRLRSGTRPGTSTFSRLYSLRLGRDGLPHFRAPPSQNPPSTAETIISAIAPLSTPPQKAGAGIRTSLRDSRLPPRRATHPPSIREAYEVTPFAFAQGPDVLSDAEADKTMNSISPPLHVQMQLQLHAKRRETYPIECAPEAAIKPAVWAAAPADVKCKFDLDAKPTLIFPMTDTTKGHPIGQRRAFFVTNKTSKSSLRSSGVPVPLVNPTEEVQKRSNDSDADYVNANNRKWRKSALARIPDEDTIDGSYSSRATESQALPPTPAPTPESKKLGKRVFFTTNPSSVSSSSISSRSLSQARRYIKWKRRRDSVPVTKSADVRPSTPRPSEGARPTSVNDIRRIPASQHVATPAPCLLDETPISLHIVTPMSPNNKPLDLTASAGVPSTESAALSDERAADFDIDSSIGKQHIPNVSQAFGTQPRTTPGWNHQSKTIFYATNPSTLSEPSVVSAEMDRPAHTDGQEYPREAREDVLLSPLSDMSSIPRPRLDKGKGRAF